MTTRLDVLEAEALKFTAADRSYLLERLIASLGADPEVERAGTEEADRRGAELASGAAFEVSGAEAVTRLQVQPSA